METISGRYQMNHEQLRSVANAMVADGKGILAADESTGTITKRLASVDVESTEENRRTYRGLLFTTPEVEEFISGVIMYDETIRQSTDDGRPFPDLLSSRGILPGIKVDKSTHPLAMHKGEVVTEGLDGLRERFAEYRDMGARFAKWRAVIRIGEGIPSDFCIRANAHALARYAALAQEEGLVPIVEPEVLMDGSHTIEQCERVTKTTLNEVFSQLIEHRIYLEGMILKPNMVIAGKETGQQSSPEEVARKTLRTFRQVVPAAVPGIVFLSGGQSPQRATQNLNAMNQMGSQPWELSFSYGRALQEPVLETWRGQEENEEKAQERLLRRARLNSSARAGEYSSDMEKAA